MFERIHPKPLTERATRVLPKSAKFYSHMPYCLEVDDETIRTRENGLLMAFEVNGIDGYTSSDQDVQDLAKSFASICDGLDERFTFHIHRLMRPARFGLKPIYGDSFERDVDECWRENLNRKKLREFVLVLTVVRKLNAPLKIPFFEKATIRLTDKDTNERLRELREVVSILETSLPIKTRRLKIGDGSMLGFLSAINTGILRPLHRGFNTLIAEDVGLVGARFKNKSIHLSEGLDKPRFAAVLAVWRYPDQSWPGMLDALDSGLDLVVSHSFTPIQRDRISEIAKRRIKQMQNNDDFAGSITDDLAKTYDDVETGRAGFGAHQFTITVFAEDLGALEERVAQVRSVAEQVRITLVRCDDTMEATFFAAHPGNEDYQCWAPVMKSLTFADMASMHMCDMGTPAAQLPWQTPITVFQSITGAAHRFSFHEAGDSKAEPTNGHALILGPQGSGKTATLAFLVAQARRTGARVIVFDKDNGLRMAIAALGGRYAEIKAGRPTGLNPLATESGPRGEAWLIDWLSRIAERSMTEKLSPQQSEALKSAVRQNSASRVELRCFQHFADLIGDVGDNRELTMRLQEWGPQGRYNWVFGEAQRPVVDFEASEVIGIDLTEILGMQTERTVVLSYIFRRLELMFEDRRPTFLVIDEASTVFDDDFFAPFLPKWLVTVRKLNVVMALLTQFPSQIRNSKSGDTIIEAIPNQLLFPNRKADASDYDKFTLTENELHFILSGRNRHRQALLRGHTGSTILDVDLSALGPLLTVLGGGDAGIRKFGADYESTPFFWRKNDD